MLTGKLLSATNAISSLTVVDTANADASTITIPSTAAAGDIAVFCDLAAGSTVTPNSFTVSGWDKIIEEFSNIASGSTGGIQRAQIFVRILTSADPGTSVTGYSADSTAGARRKVMVVYRANKSISSYVFAGYTFQYLTTDPPSRVIAAGSGVAPLIVFGVYRATATLTSTFTPAAEGSVLSGTTAQLSYKSYVSGPLDTTIDINDAGNLNYLAGFYLQVT